MAMNLSLYAVSAFVILDTDGHRVMAKYYTPKGQSYLSGKEANKGLATLKDQRAFEKGLFQKTKKAGGTCLLFVAILSCTAPHFNMGLGCGLF